MAELHTLTGSTPPGTPVAPLLSGVTPGLAEMLDAFNRINPLCAAAELRLIELREGVDTLAIAKKRVPKARRQEVDAAEAEADKLYQQLEPILFAIYDHEPSTWAELAAIARVVRERNGQAAGGMTIGVTSDIPVDFAKHAVRLGAEIYTFAIASAEAGPDAELLGLVAEAMAADARTDALGARRDALCAPVVDRPAFEAAHDEWVHALEVLWTFWPRIASLKAVTPEGWMAKVSCVLNDQDQIAFYRANPDEQVGGGEVDRSLLLDLAEAYHEGQARIAALATLPPDAELIALGAELERLWSIERGDTDEAFDAAMDRTGVIAKAIEAITPTTIAGFRVKARAAVWGYTGDTMGDGGTGDRIARRLLIDLGALDNIPSTAEPRRLTDSDGWPVRQDEATYQERAA